MQYESAHGREANNQFLTNQNQLFVPSAGISIDVERLDSSTISSFQEQPTLGGLQHLYGPLTVAGLDVSSVTSLQRKETVPGFFIPPKFLGYTLINQFLKVVDLTDLIAMKPSDQILTQVIFEPASVTQRSWVLYINFIFLIMSRNDRSLGHLTMSFRHNTRLALDDAKIFLEPSEVNVQTLTLLSVFGEDYASPDLSWILASQACRQAQALNLHLTDHQHPAEQQRRLTLFWVLFMVDKTCSLAFGHPTLLPSQVYENVPLPDFQHVLKYRPPFGPLNNRSSQPSMSIFGAHLFTQNIKLARLTGSILDLLATGNPYGGKASLISQLEDWDISTKQVLSEARDLAADHANEEQLQGMSLAVRLMRFKYLHNLVLLLQEDAQYIALRLGSAREALSLLPYLSSRNHIYNGIFWAFLYYPFTSFFVIFNHITRYPEAPTSTEDLNLLATTLSYLQSMKAKLHTQSMVPLELEHMAESFFQLARSAVLGDLPNHN
ncbi:fungal-specific transcription factor domain-containing protein [Trichoderma chlorosporum]